MATGMISTEGMSSMITDPIVMIDVECQPLPRGVGHTCLGGMMTGAPTTASEEYQSTQGSRALMRDLFSFKVWLTGTEHTEKAMTEITRLAAECMFQGQSVSAEPSGPQ